MTEPQQPTHDEWSVTDIQARFGALETASQSLSADVRALTTTLAVVNKLQTEHREIQRVAEEQQRKLNEVEQAAEERTDRAQAVLRRLTIGVAILLPLASLLVYLVLFAQVTSLLNQSQADRVKACETRNDATRSNIRREQQLADADKDPDVERIHRDSAAELQGTILDCERVTRLVRSITP